MTELVCEGVGAAAPVKTCSECGAEIVLKEGKCAPCFKAYRKVTCRRYYLRHKAKINAKTKAYKIANKAMLREADRVREQWRYKNDETFRCKKKLRSRIYSALQTGEGMKSGRGRELLGCEWQFARTYLAARFLDGMSWCGGGEWHVDHIVPCDAFDLRDPVAQLVCFNYRNLRPLWGPDNVAKHALVPSNAEQIVAAISRCLGVTPPRLKGCNLDALTSY